MFPDHDGSDYDYDTRRGNPADHEPQERGREGVDLMAALNSAMARLAERFPDGAYSPTDNEAMTNALAKRLGEDA